MNQDELKTNLLNFEHWKRIVWMALFALLGWLVIMAFLVLVVIQAVITLISAQPNRNLQKMGYLFTLYLKEVALFLTYNSHQKPWFVDEFPDDEGFSPPVFEQAPAAKPAKEEPAAAPSEPMSTTQTEATQSDSSSTSSDAGFPADSDKQDPPHS